MQIRNIVVPVDGSDNAERALELATDIGEKYGASISLLHVLLTGLEPLQATRLARKAGVPDHQLSLHGSYVDTSRQREVLEQIGNKLLEQAKARVEAAGVADVDTTMRQGPTARNILKFAKEKEADLIVMGSRGLGDISGLLLGSVSHRVQHLAKCTVITVK